MISNEHENIEAIVLVGVDRAGWLPKQEYDNAHNPIETNSACLMRSQLTSKLIAFGHTPQPHNITSTSLCQTQATPRTDNATVNVPSDTDSDTDYEDNNNFDSAYVDIHSQPPIPYEIHVHQAVSQPSPQPGEGYAYQFQCANTNTQLDCITVLDTVNHPLPR